MKLYGHPMSTCTRKVLTVLAEKGAKFDFVTLDFAKGEHKQPDHLARQPFGVVPALDHDGFALYESRAIIRYLDEVLPGTKLTPADARERAVMEQFISVEQSYFTPNAMKIIMQGLIRPQWFGQPGDEGIVKEGREGIKTSVAVLDKHLAGKDWIAGGQFSLAEICYLPYIEYLFAAKHGDLITDNKHVTAWWSRASEHKAWRAASGKDKAAT